MHVETTTIGRPFSVVNIMKTWLCNRMVDQWVTDCLIAEKYLFDQLRNKVIMDRFQHMKIVEDSCNQLARHCLSMRRHSKTYRFASLTATASSMAFEDKMLKAETKSRLSILSWFLKKQLLILLFSSSPSYIYPQ